jgi:LysM repeat protein
MLESMTPPDAAIAGPEVCPYLGLFDDPRSRFTFATPGHRCHAKANPAPIEPEYQSRFCLSTRYPACERFLSAKPAVSQGSAPVLVSRLRLTAALLAALAMVLTALLVAIRTGAISGSPAPGGIASSSPASSASASLVATPGPSPSLTAPPSPTDTATPRLIIHVVAPGETLSSIAVHYGVTVQAIQDANKIDDPSLIKAGQKLIIPAKP